tara:strand:- start:54 stop:197 length:144 start_codon:yes stop_codon:yes gene_type:complete
MNDYEGELVLQDIKAMKAKISALEVKIAALEVVINIPQGCCAEREEE